MYLTRFFISLSLSLSLSLDGRGPSHRAKGEVRFVDRGEGSRPKQQVLRPAEAMRSFLLLLWGLWGLVGASDFRICAFNVQVFGESKSKNVEVMKTLVKIIARCDVCVLQEVRDSKNKAVPKLMAELNSYYRDSRYDSVSSESLGRSAYQEQYVFVYRTATAEVVGQYQYPDNLPGSPDAFAREPFVVRFSAPSTAIKSFVLIPVHTSPENATIEIDALYDVFTAVRRKWSNENVMLLGDFNADCSYLPKKNRKNVRLLTDRRFLWLIGDDRDTTVRESTDCAYDRIVVEGNTFPGLIVPGSAEPFLFPAEYGLTEEQALSVSDHYPVQVSLRSGPDQKQRPLKSGPPPGQVLSPPLMLAVCWLAFS
ncbi:deoxyribonuclease-1-like isoform X2 [Gadus macrocephalus]|uniref:deoxyribonuclease-1-like isoform X2 n=1 Tax=Gadus macrocephalus TaxID=80720 RepID=UPI0028CB2DBC|nr:deoxyribonuclease-1-like isoform X2 [Gadus macrocephalus]